MMETMTSKITRRGALAAAAAAGLGVPAAGTAARAAQPALGRRGEGVRIATYNASLNRASAGQLLKDLESGSDAQIRAVAQVI